MLYITLVLELSTMFLGYLHALDNLLYERHHRLLRGLVDCPLHETLRPWPVRVCGQERRPHALSLPRVEAPHQGLDEAGGVAREAGRSRGPFSTAKELQVKSVGNRERYCVRYQCCSINSKFKHLRFIGQSFINIKSAG